MSDYATTSVPGWALPGAPPRDAVVLAADARSWVVVTVGGGAPDVRVAELAATPGATVVAEATSAAVRERLPAVMAAGRVGVRVAVAGSSADCLAVRGQLLSLGLEDDEVVVIAEQTGHLQVHCSHCRVTTRARAAIGDVVTCSGCGRGLQVYYHVSRLTGSYLGFDADAEASVVGLDAALENLEAPA